LDDLEGKVAGQEEVDDTDADEQISVQGLAEVETPEPETVTEEPPKDEISERISKLEKENANYKSLQRKYNKLIEEKKQPPYQPPQGSDLGAFEFMLQQEKMKPSVDELGNQVQNPAISMLEAKIRELRLQDEQRARFAQQQAIATDWRDKLENRIIEAGLDPAGEDFDDVWDAYDLSNALDGKFERAERKLERALRQAKPEEKSEVKSEEKQEKPPQGSKYKTEAVTSGGPARSYEQIAAGWIKGEIPDDTYYAARKKRGLRVPPGR
jgi:hypothetical protein